MIILCAILFLTFHTQTASSSIIDDVSRIIANVSQLFPPFKGHPNIVGGELAKEGEFPHMAAVGFGDGPNWQWKCGGSLISELFVLTAAQCPKKYGKVKIVRLGTNNLKTPGPHHQDLEVVKTISHPRYKSATGLYDMAILRVKVAITFSKYIAPASINSEEKFDVSTLTATGWGANTIGGFPKPDLYKVGLAVYEPNKCSLRFPGLSDPFIICAGKRRYQHGDTCTGDVGGPLQIVKPSGQYSIVGITNVAACGIKEKPVAYTRVSRFAYWIYGMMEKFKTI